MVDDRIYVEDDLGNRYEVRISDLEAKSYSVVPFYGPDEGKDIDIPEEEVYKLLEQHYQDLLEQEEADFEHYQHENQERHGWEQV